jgi:hypothetical protein
MFTVLADGSELKELSFPDGDIYRPLWNPVRDEILFEGVVPGEGVGLYLMSINGSTSKLPLEPKYRAPEADWSPDGTMVGYIVRFDEINPDLSRHTLHIATVDGSLDVVVLKPPEQPEEEFIIS